MTVSINYTISGGGGGGGGGVGTVKSINSINPDGGGNVALHANDVAADAQVITWNLDTNLATNPDTTTFTPTNGTFPTSGNNVLYTTGTTPRTLDGNTYSTAGIMAIMSPSMGAWIQVSPSSSTVPRVSNLVAASSWTGSTAESATQMSLTMASGTLVAGTKYSLDFQFATSNTNDTTIIKPYFNGSGTALPSAGLTIATFSSGGRMHMDAVVLSSTSIAYEMITDLSSASRQLTFGILTVTAGAGFSVAWTFTNSNTTKTAQAVMADCRIFGA